MSGGYKYDEVYGAGKVKEQDAIDISMEALKTQMGITGKPLDVHVTPWLK